MYTIKRLAKEKSHWFAHSTRQCLFMNEMFSTWLAPGTKAITLSSAVIEHCIQPRCLLSPMDADYCAQMIKCIHTMGTPGFSTLMTYDRVSIIAVSVIPN